MAENKKSFDEDLITFQNPGYQINDTYGLVFLSLASYKLFFSSFLTLKKFQVLDRRTLQIAMKINLHYYKNSIKIKQLDLMQPRLIAQKFIGKKNIRRFIFNRDKNCCLKCGNEHNLELDHIIPISMGGQNKISNLQTLCKTCNIIKRNTFKDYRHGSR